MRQNEASYFLAVLLHDECAAVRRWTCAGDETGTGKQGGFQEWDRGAQIKPHSRMIGQIIAADEGIMGVGFRE
ncbi:hypothetical protein MBOU_00350 [Mycobacterium bourgelatii]|uniref:Uncharacterized protein n=1 Tax=Mycobacterium bourgelatii TaxID=1273442 RepID=A0A7I9YHL6_MYCBU|nr:hypothetical protein MBOU_00350 [Mycobacterium bourgelatii]